MNRLDLSGRVAIVTGGALGIGLAIARRAVESGATVAIWDMDAKAGAEMAARRGTRWHPSRASHGAVAPD